MAIAMALKINIALGSNVSPPCGFRFRPYDDELIKTFLKPKNMNVCDPELDKLIMTICLLESDPSDIPRKVNMPWEDRQWYFFTERKILNTRGNRYARKGISGHWKITGTVVKIMDSETNEFIGEKRIMVYKENCNSRKRTEWVIHEYSLNDQTDRYVICCLSQNAKKDVDIPKNKIMKGEQRGTIASDAIAPANLSLLHEGGTSYHLTATIEIPAATPMEHDHDESNHHGHFSQANLSGLNEGEPSYNFTPNIEFPTSSSEEHGHDEGNHHGHFLQANLSRLNEGEPSYNFTSNIEIPSAISEEHGQDEGNHNGHFSNLSRFNEGDPSYNFTPNIEIYS